MRILSETDRPLRTKTLDAIAHVQHAMHMTNRMKARWPIEHPSVRTEEDIWSSVDLTCVIIWIARASEYAQIDLIRDPEHVIGLIGELSRRTKNHLRSKHKGLWRFSSQAILDSVGKAFEAMLRPTDRETLEDRLEEIADLLDIDVDSDLYPEEPMPGKPILDAEGLPSEQIRLLASGMARYAEERGHPAKKTWETVCMSLAQAMSTCHLGRPTFEDIPEIRRMLDHRKETSIFSFGDGPDLEAIVAEMVSCAPYAIAMNAMSGSLIIDNGFRFDEGVEELEDEIRRDIVNGRSLRDPDTILIALEENIRAYAYTLDDDLSDNGTGNWEFPEEE